MIYPEPPDTLDELERIAWKRIMHKVHALGRYNAKCASFYPLFAACLAAWWRHASRAERTAAPMDQEIAELLRRELCSWTVNVLFPDEPQALSAPSAPGGSDPPLERLFGRRPDEADAMQRTDVPGQSRLRPSWPRE
jgi:hypothetical protein